MLRLSESRFIYAPDYNERRLTPPPAELALPIERIEVTTDDSVRLVAWVIPAPIPDSAGVWMLICHGNAGNISFGGRPLFYALARQLGLNLLAFDYRGYGESEGTPSEKGLYRDAEAAYRYLREERGAPAERIFLFGHSLGSAVAIELATRVEAAGLIADAALTSIPDRGAELFPYFPVRLLASSRFASIDKVGRVTLPMLFLHPTADEVIPVTHGRRLVAAARPPAQLVELRGGHGDAYTVDEATYFGAIGDFIRRHRGR